MAPFCMNFLYNLLHGHDDEVLSLLPSGRKPHVSTKTDHGTDL
jgi:hypothetical protein